MRLIPWPRRPEPQPLPRRRPLGEVIADKLAADVLEQLLAPQAPPWCSAEYARYGGACIYPQCRCWQNAARCPECNHRVGFHSLEGCCMTADGPACSCARRPHRPW